MSAAVSVQGLGVSPANPSPHVRVRYSASVKRPTARFGFLLTDHPISMVRILASVADHYRVSVELLKGPSIARRFVIPRHEAIWLMWQTGRYSLPQIGRFMGRDHTTILHAIKAHERRRAEGADMLRRAA